MVDFAHKFPSVFHYTSFEAFEAIWTTKSLRAYHALQLNDASELQLAKDYLRPRLSHRLEEVLRANRMKFRREIQAAGGIKRLVEEESSKGLEIIHDAAFKGISHDATFPPFVTSFCTHEAGSYDHRNGLLSMWRSYGRNGVAFELDSRKLLQELETESKRFGYNLLGLSDAIYQGSEHIAHEDYGSFEDSIASMVLETMLRTRSIKDHRNALFQFLQFSGRYKHYGFREENESRILAIPYVQLSEGEFINLKKIEQDGKRIFITFYFKQLTINKIVVSPGKMQDQLFDKVMKLTNSKATLILRSNTPYID